MSTDGERMRAVVYERYGPPSVLRLEDVERPEPAEDEVLVKVRATTVTRTDCVWRAAKPFFVRYFTGLRRPPQRILGMELAGEVEAGKYRAVIDRTYRLEDVVEATTYVETGPKTGNVVLTLNGEHTASAQTSERARRAPSRPIE